MFFPDEFFEDEVRDGFYVPSLMKRCWAGSLEVLSDVVTICEKYNLKWYVDYGTLLGAVRHKGFVPWDDDLDISMPRSDYRKFMEVAAKELPDCYDISNVQIKDTFNDMLSNIGNRPAIPLTPELQVKFHGFPYVSSVDIFPLDSVDDDPQREESRKAFARMLAALSNRVETEGQDTPEIRRELQKFELLFKLKFDTQKSIYHQLYQAMDNLAAELMDVPTKQKCKSYHWLFNDTHTYPSELFDEIIKLPFEGTEVNVLKEYARFLPVHYGEDYMLPVRGEASHDYPTYTYEEDHLEEGGMELPYKYIFKASDLEHQKPDRVNPVDKISDFTTLLSKINVLLRTNMNAHQSDNCLQILGKAQDVAVQFGTYLESHAVDPVPVVSCLETYCDLAFAVYNAIAESGITDDVYKLVSEMEAAVEVATNSVASVQFTQEVVFFPFKASSWYLMKPLWKRYVSDPQYNVHVVPIPYYHVDELGHAKEPIYELDQYPEEVQAEPYESFNIDNILPQIIVTQNPYDKYSVGITIPTYYFAEHLKSCCDELVYIPWLRTEDVVFDDPFYGTALISLKSFVNMPGVTNADTVYVPSSALQNTYIELLTEFAGADTRSHWEKVVQVLKYPDETSDQ